MAVQRLATILVSVGLVPGMILTSCRSESNARADSEWWQLEGDRVAIAAEVELLQMRLGKRLEKSSQVEKAISEHESVRSRSRDLTEQAQQLRSELADMEEQIDALRLKVRRSRREASVGREFDSLVGSNGRSYKDVKITSVTDAGLVIRHSSGTARLVAADLSKDQQLEFGIDSELSRNAIAKESDRVAAYHRQLDRQEEVTRTREEREQRKLAAARARRLLTPSVAANTSTPSQNPLHQPAKPVGRSSVYRWGYSNNSRYRSYYGTSARSTGSGSYCPPSSSTSSSTPSSGHRAYGTFTP